MRFNSSRIQGLLSNEKDCVGQTVRSIPHTDKIVVAQGFGVQDSGVPLRFLAYIIPALHLLKQLPKSATAEFYTALEGVFRANKLDKRDATRNAESMRETVHTYTAALHPDQATQVVTLSDRRIESGSPLEDLVLSLAQAVEQACRADEQIWGFVEKRGGTAALRYMVEHALYMRDPIKTGADVDGLLVPEMTRDMAHVIMIGGPAEKIFHKVRQLLAETVGAHSRWRSRQLWTPIGSPPTYHVQEGEPLWANRDILPPDVKELLHITAKHVTRERRTDRSVLRDLLILLTDAASRTNFTEAKRLAKSISKGNSLPSETVGILQVGWDRLRTI